MKGFFTTIALFIFLAFAGCKKTAGPANGKSVQLNNNMDTLVAMSATINGTTFYTTDAYGYYVRYSAVDTGVVNLMITATMKRNDTTSSFLFSISNYKGPNKYLINPPVNTVTYYVGNTRYYATSGIISITSQTDYGLIGTFAFSADTLRIADGNFNVPRP